MAGFLPDTLLSEQPFLPGICRARARGGHLAQSQTAVVLKNVLHYIPQNFHDELIPEF